MNTETDQMDENIAFLDPYSNLIAQNQTFDSKRTTSSDGVDVVVDQAEKGSYIWHCTIEDLPCTQSADWNVFMSFVTDEERIKILKFRFDDDRKRALVSILLQKALVRHHLNTTLDDGFVIKRTTENKPYVVLLKDGSTKPIGHWNYNLSHHGQFVGIASHPRLLVGADLVDISTRAPSIRSARAYIEMFERNLDPKELSFILRQGNEDSIYLGFFIIWSLKESFIKAIGIGLGFELQNVCFTVKYDPLANDSGSIRGSATATICGVFRSDWKFDFFSLDNRHIMAVARGPIADALESYRNCAFTDPPYLKGSFTDSLMSSELHTISTLLTEHQLELYRKACLLPQHVIEVCPCCTPTPILSGPGVFLDSDHFCCSSGHDECEDVLITGTPMPRTPFTLPRTPAFAFQPEQRMDVITDRCCDRCSIM